MEDNTKEKILLLLLSGVALCCAHSARGQRFVLKTATAEWKRLDRKKLRTNINSFYRSKYITKSKNNDGSFNISITDIGKLRALNIKIKNLREKKQEWDGKWRMVVFDVPEQFRSGRNALRQKLKNMGFKELQKSVFVFPYDCQKEIDLLLEVFHIEKYVRFAILEYINNASELAEEFKLQKS
jgi:DNA-binding transcriptional regulator PaaX